MSRRSQPVPVQSTCEMTPEFVSPVGDPPDAAPPTRGSLEATYRRGRCAVPVTMSPVTRRVSAALYPIRPSTARLTAGTVEIVIPQAATKTTEATPTVIPW